MNGPKNIIIICIDALRYDCIGAIPDKKLLDHYNVSDRIHTPFLDSFAQNGTLFTQCISSANVTTSSLASLMSGMSLPSHGVRQYYKNRLNSKIVTLAQFLKSSGFVTIQGDELQSINALGINRGMDHCFRANDSDLWKCLQKNADKRTFLFLHLFDVHDPYRYSHDTESNSDFDATFADLRKRFGVKLRDEEYPHYLTYLDLVQKIFDSGEVDLLFKEYISGVNKFDAGRLQNIYRKLETAGLLDDSLIIITSDHGEGPGSKSFGHGNELFDGTIRIPLIMNCPDLIPAGNTIDTQVRLIDLFPTILSITGTQDKIDSLPYELDGADLRPVISGEETADRDAYAEIWAHSGGLDEFHDALTENSAAREHTVTWKLFQKSLRSNGYKCIIQGDNYDDTKLDKSLPAVEFVRAVYRKILRREADDSGLKHHTELLESGVITHEALVETFRTTAEYKNNYQLYNLQSDPHEYKNLYDSNVFDENWKQFQVCEQKILLESAKNEQFLEEQVLYNSEAEQQAIEDRLKALGYL